MTNRYLKKYNVIWLNKYTDILQLILIAWYTRYLQCLFSFIYIYIYIFSILLKIIQIKNSVFPTSMVKLDSSLVGSGGVLATRRQELQDLSPEELAAARAAEVREKKVRDWWCEWVLGVQSRTQVRILPLHMLERSNRRQMNELFKLLRKNGQVGAMGLWPNQIWLDILKLTMGWFANDCFAAL